VIAENSGLNATEVIGQLKAAHAKGEHQAGLDIETGEAKDLATIGIVDLFSAKVRAQNLSPATTPWPRGGEGNVWPRRLGRCRQVGRGGGPHVLLPFYQFLQLSRQFKWLSCVTQPGFFARGGGGGPRAGTCQVLSSLSNAEWMSATGKILFPRCWALKLSMYAMVCGFL